ncbi:MULTISPECIES: MarR family winged helix-turn-helix transcriptional regulator [Streptomyces]|uniref:Transcriptional regulator, MarR family n=1 Tax=Streptomyces venezuelae (strain ATCC 10712 / CBS 650.69 / DSM 40230 / JCM 4526 / NBRC 13096 / PD 04745) TaxID=953739 RepID=F2R217_STRVP|nr:MarR family transcriptional regulator [Streptomyces venezuelae]CCA60684.1 Transcriptional regulator, MarR family [Streptomyces venezuelae ATCC 10712]
MELCGRIQRLARVIDKSVKASAAAHGVEHGEFDVLTTLQRSGPPYALTAGAFLKASMVTSGAITNRIDRMEAKGLVERVRDTADRRTIKIRLTDHGHEVTCAAFADHLANYARLLADVDRDLVAQTAAGLRQILETLGDTGIGVTAARIGPRGPAPAAPPGPRNDPPREPNYAPGERRRAPPALTPHS